MKIITNGDNIIINAESIDCIDVHFTDDGTYLYVNFLLHGETKQIDYKNTNPAFFKVSDGKNFRTPYGVMCCNVEQSRGLCISFISGKLIRFLQCKDKSILDINDAIQEVINSKDIIPCQGVLLDD